MRSALIATYIIKAAKSYVDGCGGDTDVWVFRPSGSLVVRSDTTDSAEQHFGWIEHFCSEVFSGLFLGIEEAEFEERLTRMSQRLRTERTELMRFLNGPK